MADRYTNLRTPWGRVKKRSAASDRGKTGVYNHRIYLLSSRITTPYVAGKEYPGSPGTPDYALHKPTLKDVILLRIDNLLHVFLRK
jgi:hypothetical protein